MLNSVPDLQARDLTTIAEMGITDIYDLLAEMLDWASDCWGPENGMPAEPSYRWLVTTVRHHYYGGLAAFLADYRSWYPNKVK